MLSPAQLPPRALGASHNVWIVPAATETFFSFPCAKKPIHSSIWREERIGGLLRSRKSLRFDAIDGAHVTVCSRPLVIPTYTTSVPWGETAKAS